MSDAVVAHKFLKARFKAELNDLNFYIMDEWFGLSEKSGKPITGSKSLDDILKVLDDEKYKDVGFYTS